MFGPEVEVKAASKVKTNIRQTMRASVTLESGDWVALLLALLLAWWKMDQVIGQGHRVLRQDTLLSQCLCHPGAGMVQWSERLPPTIVARVRFPDLASHVG